MRSKAIVTATALGLLSALTVAGCGSNPGDSANRVVYWDTSGSNESPVFKEIAQECGRTGGYEVAVETVTFDQALNNFKTSTQSGRGPDVLRADVGWVAQLANAGLIKDLSGTPLAADTSDFLDEPLKSTRHEGKTYAVPPGHRHPRLVLQQADARRSRRPAAEDVGRAQADRTEARW